MGKIQERVGLRRDLGLADERVSAKRGTRVRARLRRLGRAFRASLKGYRIRRVEDAGKDVEALLGGDPPNAKEAGRRMKGWYSDKVSDEIGRAHV